ncbi:MAG: N-acetylmuramoyl-L-alanine amidase [Rhodospirillaceae bacterium]|nr:N-acetylmuramoyl-L-alanine amidase [Rhodospirillaceae bacterium]
MLVIHYTGMPDCGEALDRLCDPAAKVSAHYLIARDGTAWRMVAEDRRAWHAGVSRWGGVTDVNGASIGIELDNPGHEWGYVPFTEPQMARLIGLARDILDRHPIPPVGVVGHSDVAPSRKTDPGELFDWRRLAAAGIGLWPEDLPDAAGRALGPGDSGPAVAALRRDLARFGWGVDAGDDYDAVLEAVVVAFQRHFRPERVDGVFDPDCAARLSGLLLISGTGGRS